MNYSKLLRKLRQRAFDYPESKAAKFDRILAKVKARYMASPAKREEIAQHEMHMSERLLRLWA